MYLPEIFQQFTRDHKEIADALGRVADLCCDAGPIEGKQRHLVQLGVAIGAQSKGAVRSHARRALQAGASAEEVAQVVLLSVSLIGFPGMIASYGWVREILEAGDTSD
ncbi:MAG: carboxymuconolactone decarboxylase family protein [Desulfomonile sp.]|nr:carboxymuconolactone decarboxylase family protein [Desulfomonile sp.]